MVFISGGGGCLSPWDTFRSIYLITLGLFVINKPGFYRVMGLVP